MCGAKINAARDSCEVTREYPFGAFPVSRPVSGRACRLVLEDDFGECRVTAVGDADADLAHAQALSMFARRAMQLERRLAAGLPRHLDIAPPYSASPAGAERLHRRFLGRKASGIALKTVAIPLAISDFRGRKHTFEE